MGADDRAHLVGDAIVAVEELVRCGEERLNGLEPDASATGDGAPLGRMRIVLTGSSGRIGRALYRRLAPSHEVVGVDRVPASTTHLVGDLLDPALLAAACAGADAVVHAAALHAPHVGLVPDAEFRRVNVEGTRAVLEAALAAGVGRLVFTSTTALYGHAIVPGRCTWVDETTPPRPRTIYHETKLAAEALLRAAAERTGVAVRVLRMSRCFPEPAPLMAVYRLHRGVDARDVADAHARALADGGAADAPYQCYVISGAPAFAPEELPALARDAPAVLAARVPALAAAFAARGWALPRMIDRVYDPARARGALGWTPRHGWDEVLAEWERESPEVLPPPRMAFGQSQSALDGPAGA